MPCPGPDSGPPVGVLGCIPPVCNPPLREPIRGDEEKRHEAGERLGGNEAILHQTPFLASPDQPIGSRPRHSAERRLIHTQPAGLGLHFVPALGFLTPFVPPRIGGVASARRPGWSFAFAFVSQRWHMQGLSQSCGWCPIASATRIAENVRICNWEKHEVWVGS